MPTVAAVAAFFSITSTAVATAVTIAIDIALNFALGKLTQALSGKAKQFGPTLQAITVKGTIQPRSIIYGEVATSGVIVFEGTTGTDNEYLWVVIALAGHQCDAITDVWIDSERIPDSAINSTTGLVNSGRFATKATIWRKLGPSTETALSDLVLASGGEITGDHIGYGVAKLIIRLQRDATVFPGGAPQTYRALVRGKRVYDPRLDSTNGGSGTHRLADATTWQYSANPALCTADYFHGGSIYFDVATPLTRLGMGLPTNRVNWTYVASAANDCDNTVTIPLTTQTRYLLGIVLSCGDLHDTNVDKLLATMLGQRIFVSGAYRIYAGVYNTPAASIGDDNLTVDGYSLQGAAAGVDLYNQVSASYFDPARDWQEVPCAVRVESTYEAEDGGPILKNIDLSGVTNEYRAQRLCEITKKQSRNQVGVVLNCKLSADKVAPWETFNLTLVEQGWVNKVFRAQAIQADLSRRRIQITAKEESLGAYADPAAADYAAPGTAAPSSTLERPSQPSGLAALSVQNGIAFTWTASTYLPPGASYELYEYTTATGFGSATLIAAGLSVTTVTIYKGDLTERYYWILARSFQGRASNQFPSGNGVAGKAGSLTSAFTVSASPASLSTTVTTASATTASTTVTPTNGTAPFTYAWTWSTGGTGISITSASSASTTFSAATLSTPETRTGQALCTVTDNAAVVHTITVSVTIQRISTALAATVSPATCRRGTTNGSLTTPAAVVTASQGTPGYTYAWTWQSGGTGITINSPSASSTTFSAVSLTPGQLRTGVAQCVVTDTASATVTVTVNVEVEWIT